MKKPYWTVTGYNRKFYTFEKAEHFANVIERETGCRPTTTYFRMIGGLLVRSTFGGSQ
jgi:NADH:ubiquinone oxidoreductase subunit D